MEQLAAESFFAAVGQPMPPLTVRLEEVTHVPAPWGWGAAARTRRHCCGACGPRYAPDLPVERLQAVGLTVGSDVPFCIAGGTALAEGRGERLTALPALPDCRIVLCKPDFGIPTPSLFARADDVCPKRRPDAAGMLQALAAGSLEDAAAGLCNVFEEVLPEEYREAFRIRARLLELGAPQRRHERLRPGGVRHFPGGSGGGSGSGCAEGAVRPDVSGAPRGTTGITGIEE